MSEHKKKVLILMGTRPEVIKLSPVVSALKTVPDLDVEVVRSGQHQSIFDDVARVFGIVPSIECSSSMHETTLTSKLAKLLREFSDVGLQHQPDMVIAQGDTLSVLAAAQWSFLERIPFAHVEAGLRTHSMSAPFPEEYCRVVASVAATLHFAPTERALQNLLAEGVGPDRVHLTGNTIVDAVEEILKRQESLPAIVKFLRSMSHDQRKTVVLTAHRRETFVGGAIELMEAVKRLAQSQAVQIVWPVHPSPLVQTAAKHLADLKNVHLVSPMAYDEFLSLLSTSDLILTDSGGIQEEATVLGKPVLILRNMTERPEVIDAGLGTLVGTSPEKILKAASEILTNTSTSGETAQTSHIFGDGSASLKIARCVQTELFG